MRRGCETCIGVHVKEEEEEERDRRAEKGE